MHVTGGGKTPTPEQVSRVKGKTQKFKATVPAHRPPTLSRARQRASQLFFGRGGGGGGGGGGERHGNSLTLGGGEFSYCNFFSPSSPLGEVERLIA